MKQLSIWFDKYEVFIDVDTISEEGYADVNTYSVSKVVDSERKVIVSNPAILDWIDNEVSKSSIASLLESL